MVSCIHTNIKEHSFLKIFTLQGVWKAAHTCMDKAFGCLWLYLDVLGLYFVASLKLLVSFWGLEVLYMLVQHCIVLCVYFHFNYALLETVKICRVQFCFPQHNHQFSCGAWGLCPELYVELLDGWLTMPTGQQRLVATAKGNSGVESEQDWGWVQTKSSGVVENAAKKWDLLQSCCSGFRHVWWPKLL